jgi:hypothetical protein
LKKANNLLMKQCTGSAKEIQRQKPKQEQTPEKTIPCNKNHHSKTGTKNTIPPHQKNETAG